MFALERQKRILEILNDDGAVWVSKLSDELGVTEETVRRDLEKLEKQEVLIRTHGGAIPMGDTSSYDLSLEKRKQTNSAAKEQLAIEAAKHILPGDTIFLDSSTTTFYMAKEIKKLKNVTVITHSLRVINELAGVDSVKLITVGGLVSANQSFVGTLAENTIRNNFFASKVFFSSKGIKADAGILESNEQECFIKHQMIANANEKYYLCDSTKIDKVGFYKLASLDSIDYFITNGDLDKKYLDRFSEADIKFIKVENNE